MKTHVKKGDEVEIIAGRNHKGKRGTVLAVNASKSPVIAAGVRTPKKAVSPKEQNQEGGTQEITGPIHISNVKKVG